MGLKAGSKDCASAWWCAMKVFQEAALPLSCTTDALGFAHRSLPNQMNGGNVSLKPQGGWQCLDSVALAPPLFAGWARPREQQQGASFQE